MKELKNLKIVLLVLFVVFVLVILRTTGKNRFKQDAKNVIEATKRNEYSVSDEEIKEKESQYLIVDLNNNATPGQKQFKGSTQIPFDKLLEESSLLKLQQTDNKILLTSDNNSLAIKAWVILNQMEFKNVFVFSNEENPEVLKYEFQPDTLVRLESVSE